MNRSSIDKQELERRTSIVLRDYRGILPHAEAFFLHSILYSARRALRAFEEYDSLPRDQEHAEQLVGAVQEAVGHAGALSRYFWPSMVGHNAKRPLDRIKEGRAEKLRASFNLAETSPLYNRQLRNAWEHFDERLDAYLIENDTGFFFPGCVLDDHTLADDPKGHLFKLIDPAAECLVLLGEKYFFAPIRNEVRVVFDQAAAAERDGSRFRQTAR